MRFFLCAWGIVVMVAAGCDQHPTQPVRPPPSAQLSAELSAQHLHLPKCSDCRVEGEGWRTSRDGNLLLAGDNRSHLRVLVVDGKSLSDSQKFVNMQGLILQSTYKTIPSPYIAMITRKVHCSKKFRPVVRNGQANSFILTPVNARLDFGVCARAEAKFWSGVRFYYDAQRKRAIKIERFVPFSKSGLVELNKFMAELQLDMAGFKTLLPANMKAKR